MCHGRPGCYIRFKYLNYNIKPGRPSCLCCNIRAMPLRPRFVPDTCPWRRRREFCAKQRPTIQGLYMTTSPKLAVGDGALGFWKALAKCYPDTRHQRCWVHKTANILSALPKSVQPKVKAALHDIWMAETQDDAHKAFDRALVRFESKYPGAMERLRKDREELLAFYDFPAEQIGRASCRERV